MSATKIPPKGVAFSIELQPVVWVTLRGDVVLPFWEWFDKQDFQQCRSMVAGPDVYIALFEPEDAEKIAEWAKAWSRDL